MNFTDKKTAFTIFEDNPESDKNDFCCFGGYSNMNDVTARIVYYNEPYTHSFPAYDGKGTHINLRLDKIVSINPSDSIIISNTDGLYDNTYEVIDVNHYIKGNYSNILIASPIKKYNTSNSFGAKIDNETGGTVTKIAQPKIPKWAYWVGGAVVLVLISLLIKKMLKK